MRVEEVSAPAARIARRRAVLALRQPARFQTRLDATRGRCVDLTLTRDSRGHMVFALR